MRVVGERNELMGIQSKTVRNTKVHFIPFVKEGALRISALLMVKVNGTDTAYKMIYRQHYLKYGFEERAGKWNARTVMLLFAMMEEQVFGYKNFLVNDGRIMGGKIGERFRISFEKDPASSDPNNQRSELVSTCKNYKSCFTVGGPMTCNTRSICKTTFVDDGAPGEWETLHPDETGAGDNTSDGGIMDEQPCVVQPGTTAITWQEPSGVVYVLNPCDENAWEIDKIVNNLNNPCLSNTLVELTQNNYSGTIGQMLNTIWGVSANCDIVFYETDTLDYFKDGKTNTITQDGITKSEIRLNATVLPNASREYVAATMFHEALHANLNLNGSFGNLLNHNVMATNQYVDMLVNTLMAKFPTMELQDAKALAWGGLQDTDAWKVDLKINNPTLYDDLRIRNSQHRVRTKGTSCQ